MEQDISELYVVRFYDGFDNLWMDITRPVSKKEAEAVLSERTEKGTKNTKYADIDYYAVFKADTRMIFS